MFQKRVSRIANGIAVSALAAVIGYACIFNTFTLTRVVLPLLSSLSGVEMRAGELNYALFTGRAAARNICIGPEQAPWFRAAEAHFSFDITKAFRNKFRFEDVWILGGDFLVTQHENGWEIGPPSVPEQTQESNTLSAENEDSSSDAVFELCRITLCDSTFRVRWGERRKHCLFTMYNVNGYAGWFRQGNPFNGQLSGKVRMAGQKTNRIDQGMVHMVWHNRLLNDLSPEYFVWKLRLDKLKGTANGKPFENNTLALDLSGRQENGAFIADHLELSQLRNDEVRSKVDFKGELSSHLSAGRGEIRTGKLSPELLAFAGDFFYNINPGMVRMTCEGNFLWNEQQFNATGKFQVIREGDAVISGRQIPLPPMEFDSKYDLRVNRQKKELDLAEFKMTALSRGRQIASLQLRQPLKYSRKEEKSEAVKPQQAVFDLRCDGLDINFLQFFLSQDSDFAVNSGRIFSKAAIVFRNDFKTFDISGNTRISGLNWSQEQKLRKLDEVRIFLRGVLDEKLSVKLDEASLEIQDRNVLLGKLELTGRWDCPAGKSFFSVKLLELAPEAVAWYRQIPDEPVLKALQLGKSSAELKGYLDLEADTAYLDELSVRSTLGGKLELTLSAAPSAYDFSGDKLLENMKFRLSAKGEAAALGGLLKYCDLPLPAAGRIAGSVRGTLSRDYSWLLFDGDASVRSLDCPAPWQNISNTDIESRFSCFLRDMEQLEFRKADVHVRRKNQPAMRIDCPGTWDIRSGRYLGNWKLRYLNEHFLSIFYSVPGMEADFCGSLQLTLKNDFAKQKLVADLDCSQLKLPGQEAVKGRWSGVFENSFSHLAVPQLAVTLQQADKTILQLDGSGQYMWDKEKSEYSLVRLQSGRSDIPRLSALINAFSSAGKKSESRPSKPSVGSRPPKPRLDLKSYPAYVDVDLKNCTITSELTADLSGKLQIGRDRLRLEEFSFAAGRSLFNGFLSLQNDPGGIALKGNLKGGEVPMSIRPLVELLRGYPMKHLKGTVGNVDCRIASLNDGSKGSWLNSVNGSLKADFRDLYIPSNLSTGPFGRLLLYPVDVAAQLVGYLPNDLADWKARFSLNRDREYSGVGVLRFDQGNVRLRCNAGKITVDHCHFLGPSVKRLSFEGDVELKDQQSVNLKARFSAIGGQLLIPIAGTLSDPELNWRTIAADPAVEVLRKIRNLKVVGINHQQNDKDEPLIVLKDLPVSVFLKNVHGLAAELFR